MTTTLRARAMMPQDHKLLSELERFLEPYRSEFRRQDQVRRAAAYLLGLLRCTGRKNIENLARALTLPADWGVNKTAQALQHFVNQSPWNDDNILRLYARQVKADSVGVLVVSEQTFLKQGRHSVGVQRQYSSTLDRKVNCQLAIAVQSVTESSFVPLGVRLYLPRGWTQDSPRLAEAGVPPLSEPAGKTALALESIDRVLAEGWTARGVAVRSWAGAEAELREGVAARGLEFLGSLSETLAGILAEGERRLLEDLGLDHFEGRSWRGFHHHACLVLLAHAFLRSRRNEPE